MTEVSALVRREWILTRRWLLALAALTFAGYAALYVLCQPADRYRLLCDAALLRRVALPSALAAGAALAYRSFAYEVRTQTWDNVLLLPIPRSTVIAVKFGFAACMLTALIVLPMVALWARLASTAPTGGPLLTVAQLFSHSILGRAALIGIATYCAGAAAALGVRADGKLFWTPLTLPALLFFTANGDDPKRITGAVAGVVLFASALSLWRVASEARESAAKPSSRLVALRAAAHVPLLVTVLLFAQGVAVDVLYRRGVESVRDADAPSYGVDDRGRIGWSRRTLAGRSLQERSDRSAFDDRRLWQPRLLHRGVQYFIDEQQNLLLGFNTSTGHRVGCIGRDGLRPSACRPFSSTPAIVGSEPPLFIGGDFVLAFRSSHGSRAALETVFTGPIGPIAEEVDDSRLTFQSGDDLLAINVAPSPEVSASDASDADDSPDASGDDGLRLRVDVLCRGVGRFGRIEEYAFGEDFIAVYARRPREHQQTYAVCRDGVVTVSETRTSVERMNVPPRPMRDYVVFAVLGPIASSAHSIERRYSINGALQFDRPLDRRPTWAVAVLAALVALAVGARRRRFELSAAIATVLIGPAFLLAWWITRARMARR